MVIDQTITLTQTQIIELLATCFKKEKDDVKLVITFPSSNRSVPERSITIVYTSPDHSTARVQALINNNVDIPISMPEK